MKKIIILFQKKLKSVQLANKCWFDFIELRNLMENIFDIPKVIGISVLIHYYLPDDIFIKFKN